MDPDTLTFVIVVISFATIGVYVAIQRNDATTVVSGTVLFAFSSLLLIATGNPVTDPLVVFLKGFSENSLTLALIGIIVFFGGMLQVAFSRARVTDLIGLFIIFIGVVLLYASGATNPLIRELLELKTSDAII